MVANLVFIIFKILLLKSAVRLEAATSVNQTQQFTTTPSTGTATIIFVTSLLPSYTHPGTSSLNEQNSALGALKATYSSDNTTFANKYSSSFCENVNPLSTDTVLQSSTSTQRLQNTVMRRSSELVVHQASSSSSNQQLTKSATQVRDKSMNITTILQNTQPHQVTTFAVSSVYSETQATKISSESAETKKVAINPRSLPTLISTVFVSSLPQVTQTEKSSPIVVASESKTSKEAVFSTNTPHSVRKSAETQLPYSTKEIVEFQAESSSVLSTYSSLDKQKQKETSPPMPVTKERIANTTVFAYYVSPSAVSTILRSPFNEKTAETEVRYSKEEILDTSSFHSTFSDSFLYKTKLIEKSYFILSTSDSEAKTTVLGNVLPSVTVTSVASHSIQKTVDAKIIHSTPKIKDSSTIRVAYPFSSIDIKNVTKSSFDPISSFTKTKVIQDSSYTAASIKVFPNVPPSLIATNLTFQYAQQTSKAKMLYPSSEIKVSTSFRSTYSASSHLKAEPIDESSSIPTATKESNKDKTTFPSYVPSVVATNLTSQSVQKTPKPEAPYSTKVIKVSTSFPSTPKAEIRYSTKVSKSFLPTHSVSSVEQTKQVDKFPSIAASRTNMIVPPSNLSTMIATNRSSTFIQKTAVPEKPFATSSLLINSTFSLHKAKQTEETAIFPVAKESTQNVTVLASALPSMDIATSTLSYFIHMTPIVEILSSSKELKASGTLNSTYSVDSLGKTKEIRNLSSIFVTSERKSNRTVFPNVLPSIVARNKTSSSVQKTVIETPQSTKEIKELRTSVSIYSSSSSPQPKQLEESSSTIILLSRQSATKITEFPNVLPSVVATNTTIGASYTSKEIKEATIFLSSYSVSSLSKAKQLEESRSIPLSKEIGKTNMTVSTTVVPKVVATSTISRSLHTKIETPYSTKDITEATESFHSTYSISTVQETKDIKLSSITEKSKSNTTVFTNVSRSMVSTTASVSEPIQTTTKSEIPYATKQIEKSKSSILLTASSSSLYKAKDIKESSSIYAQIETKTLTVFASFSPRVVATNTISHKVQKTAYLKTEVTYSSKEIKTSMMLPLPQSTMKFQTTQTVVPTAPDDTERIVQEFRIIFKITSEPFTNELSRQTSKKFKEKSQEIEEKLNEIYTDNIPEYSYSKVLRFFEGSLGCEVAIFLESKDTSPVPEQVVKDVLLRGKENGVFGDFVDLDVKEVKSEEKDKEAKTWGRWPVVVVSILGGICLVLLVVIITQCIQKRHYPHSIAESSGFPDSPSIRLKASKNHDHSDEERIPMRTFQPDISLV